jgi:hypothetical protein
MHRDIDQWALDADRERLAHVEAGSACLLDDEPVKRMPDKVVWQ